MKTKILLLPFIFFICSMVLNAQESESYRYWKMEQDSAYKALQSRQNAGETLSADEAAYLQNYRSKLQQAFDRMPDAEKAVYFQNRSSWSGDERFPVKVERDDAMSDQGDRSVYIKHLLYSGYYGFYYGLGFNLLFDIDGAGAAGLPFVSAGVSTLFPMLTLEDKLVCTNSLLLAGHGKLVGGFQGAALGFLIVGESNSTFAEKFVITSAMASSIGLGRLGFKLGKREDLSQGQVALYRHYGLLMPLEGVALGAALEVENSRVYSALLLGFGATGYLAANHIGKQRNFTRGDVLGMQTFTLMNVFLGGGIMADYGEGSAAVLIPATLALGGTLLGQQLFRNAKLSTQQGRYTLYGASGGMLIGLGLTLMVQPETATPYYVVPYLTGMTSYLLFSRKFILENNTRRLLDQSSNNWDLQINPENYFLARKLNAKYAQDPAFYQVPPVITARLRF